MLTKMDIMHLSISTTSLIPSHELITQTMSHKTDLEKNVNSKCDKCPCYYDT